MTDRDDFLLEYSFKTLSLLAFLVRFDRCAIARPTDKPRQPAFRAAAFLLTDPARLEKFIINQEKEGENTQ